MYILIKMNHFNNQHLIKLWIDTGTCLQLMAVINLSIIAFDEI